MKILPLVALLLSWALPARAVVDDGPFAPAAGQAGSTAVSFNDARIKGWASGAILQRGPLIDADGEDVSTGNWFGTAASALGPSNALSGGGTSEDGGSAVSLGDGGKITLTFDAPITNGPGFDFAVFENSFNDYFLELAFVEVSSDGTNFFRFPSVSLTPTDQQIDQATSNNGISPTNIDGLAGKYRVGFGTPFDLQRLAGATMQLGGTTVSLDIFRITHVRIIDVWGAIEAPDGLDMQPSYDSAATYNFDGHSFTTNHIINDPWPTDFYSGGFDLDAIAVLNQVPEPGAGLLCVAGLIGVLALDRRRR